MKEILTILLAAALVTGCSRREAPHEHEHGGAHEAAHGGVLNAIEKCSVGHVEALLEGKKLTLYFVGGHDRTQTSLRIEAREISLAVKLADGTEESLTLLAKPLKLAGEEVGDCSRFEGEADFLEEIKKFQASGEVEVDGKLRKLTVKYPEGYNPDHEGHGRERGEEGEQQR